MSMAKTLFVTFGSFFLLSTSLAVNGASAGVIFEEDFDSQVNWNVDKSTNGDGCTSIPCTGTPAKWSFYRETPGNAQFANPPGSIQGLPGGLTDHTGSPSGKAYLIYQESNNAINWPGDSMLGKVFSQDYPELYVRYWLRTQSNWQSVTSAEIKVSRVAHFDPGGNPSSFFSAGDYGPIQLFFLGEDYVGRGAYAFGYRCAPQSTDYYCSSAPSYEGTDTLLFFGTGGPPSNYADTNWHRYDFHYKMNTIGSNNGVMEFWLDGNLVYAKTDVLWNESGSSASGWNTVVIGGNSDNSFSGSSNGEQWYAIDDLVVSTTPIPANYVVGGGGDTTPPKAPAGLRVR